MEVARWSGTSREQPCWRLNAFSQQHTISRPCLSRDRDNDNQHVARSTEALAVLTTASRQNGSCLLVKGHVARPGWPAPASPAHPHPKLTFSIWARPTCMQPGGQDREQ